MSRTFRIGAFLVSTLLILAAGIFLIGRNRFLFAKTYRLRAEFANVTGLTPGAEVRVGGTRQGYVRRIELPAHPGGKVTVVMDLNTGTASVVKKDSVAAIRAEGLMGAKYVEVSFGSDEVVRVKDGDTIGSEPPVDLADLLKTANQILDSTKQTVDNVQSISAKIDEGKGAAGAFVNDRKIYDQASAAATEAKAGATAFHDNMVALQHNFLLRAFFHHRGYDDSTDPAKHAISQLPKGRPLKQFTYSSDQLFAGPGTARLKNPRDLKEAGSFLEANQFRLAVVVAHSGKGGDADANRALTQARAMVLRDYLAKNFKLDDTRVKTIGAGERKDAGERGTVEIIVYPAARS